MKGPIPVPVLVIRYACLWEREARAGSDEGVKDWPCVLIIVTRGVNLALVVRVPQITRGPPANSEDALEIPAPIKRRLGLDDEKSWVVLTEGNDPRRRNELRSGNAAARIHESVEATARPALARAACDHSEARRLVSNALHLAILGGDGRQEIVGVSGGETAAVAIWRSSRRVRRRPGR